jgi:hypothetical protein
MQHSLQALLLARAGQLTAAALLASLQTVLSSSTGSSVSSLDAAVIGALAQALVTADWQTLPDCHSPLLGESSLVSFPPLSYMLKFSGSSYLIGGPMLSVCVFVHS